MDITRENIINELGAIAFARTTDFLTVQDGSLMVGDTGALPPEISCAIASIEKAPGGIKVKFYDKLKALELLGKAVGLFDGGVEAGGENGLLEAILAATHGELTVDS